MKSSRFSQFNTILSLLLLLLNVNQHAFAEGADESACEVKQIQVGFDGLYKIGRWVPVTVELTTTAPIELQLSVVSLSPDGNSTEVPSDVYRFPKPGTYQLYSQFKTGLLDSPLKIRLRDIGTQAILHEYSYSPQSTQNQFTGIGLKQSVELWAIIGKTSGFDPIEPAGLDSIDKKLNQFTTLISDQSFLPETDYGYDSLDSLILDSDYTVSAEKNRAIQNWVANGGHLVLCVGQDLEKYQKSEFSKWVPVKVLGENKVRELSSLELFAAVRSRIRGVATASQIEINSGEVLASSLNGPILVRVPFGLGVVTFLALDLNTSPLVNWEGLENLCVKLATRKKQPVAANEQEAALGKRLSQTGISELETQLFHSQQNFPQAERSSHWWVMSLILIYLLLIGPLDYFLVHRILKKPHITWVTFPSMVLIAAVWGVATAQNDNGRSLQSTQLNLVDYDVSEGQLRGRFYLSLYSPETRRYQIDVQSSIPVQDEKRKLVPTQICWNGLPETTFAGMYRSAEGTMSAPAYEFSPQSKSIVNLPILKWGTKSLLAEWTQKQPELFSSNLTGNSLSRLSGTFTNRLTVPLKEWVLAYGNRIYLPLVDPEHLEDSFIPPNQNWDITSPNITSRNIKGYLTRSVSRRLPKQGQNTASVVTEQTDYDAFSKDVYDILKMLTFHEMSGGYGYTGLSNISAEQLDFSEQLRLGRAVLFARLDTPLSQASLDNKKLDQTNQSAYIRVVIPVTKSTKIQYELPSLKEKDNPPNDQQDPPAGSDNK
ncbi:hypothetical protein [Gimesia aquarii]|uniref:DUF2330 domain-containing protein n=1 Tax=Gimesia aquarii TaxID=2527964 RepID=A0A517WZK0_9PLAN|nr:hypothetical protein [Gimesia aquarii]QDU10680.1 hypothetical protein V202x_40920 [Gimesia aquarii]